VVPIACRIISEANPYGLKNLQDTPNGALKIILKIVERDDMFAAWITSPTFFDDLELLYFVHHP
jgi:hypothetical protein